MEHEPDVLQKFQLKNLKGTAAGYIKCFYSVP